MTAFPLQRNRTCKQCGTSPIAGYKFCSPECRSAFADADKPQRLIQPPAIIQDLACVVCDSLFNRRTKGRDAGLCCSRACGFELQRRRGRERREATEALNTLRRCERHSRDQVAREAAAREREVALILRNEAHAGRPCRTCGKAVGYSGSGVPKAYCSIGCRPRTAVDPRDRRIRKGVDRARRYGVLAEPIDPIAIMERDGWRCHICGGIAPRDRRGTMQWDAPELDHIIPLARGGSHAPSNVACAHRACNIAKGDAEASTSPQSAPQRRWVHHG